MNNEDNKSTEYKDLAEQYAVRFRNENLLNKGRAINTTENPVYVMYLRKSTKGNERQKTSHKQQLEACEKYAKDAGLQLAPVAPIAESDTAKTTGRRKFKLMLDELKDTSSRRFNSILCWHPDRLARNMKDAGEVIDLLDKGIIKDLKFASYTFNNDANGKMALGIQFVLAKQYSDNLSDNTKRGNKHHVLKAESVGTRKFGYKIKDKHYVADTLIFEFLRQAKELLLRGYSLGALVDVFENGPYSLEESITKNKLSRVFMDPFYCGYFVYGDSIVNLNEVDENFVSLCTYEEFCNIRRRLSESKRKHVRKPGKVKTPLFRDMLLCKACGNYLKPTINSNGKDKHNRYFRVDCRHHGCPMKRRSIRGKVILEQVVRLLKANFRVTREQYENYILMVKNFVDKEYQDKQLELRKIRELITRSKRKIENLDEKIENEEDKVVRRKLIQIQDKYSFDVRESRKDEQKLVSEVLDIDIYSKTEIVDFEEFANFFKNVGNYIPNLTNQFLIDKIMRMIFANLTLEGETIVDFVPQEPFETFTAAKYLIMGG